MHDFEIEYLIYLLKNNINEDIPPSYAEIYNEYILCTNASELNIWRNKYINLYPYSSGAIHMFIDDRISAL